MQPRLKKRLKPKLHIFRLFLSNNPFLFTLRLLRFVGSRRVFLCSCCTMDSSAAQLHTSHAIARHRAFLAASARSISSSTLLDSFAIQIDLYTKLDPHITKLASVYYEIRGSCSILRESTRYHKLKAVCKLEFTTDNMIIARCKILSLKFVFLG